MQLYIENFWNYMALSAPFFLFGLLLAGIIKTFISMDRIQKSLGGNSPFTFFKAAFIGIPLPLCSCSVIPTAVTLRKAGANNAATSSFLISTPESGVDSISFTYAIMDLPMTVIRPIAAFVSAMVAGFLQFFFNDFEMQKVEEKKSCCCGSKKAPAVKENKLWQALKFAANDIIDDIAFWMLIGISLGALIETVVPAQFLSGLNGTGGKLLVLLIGIPLYICASSSTPLAASLIMKGMSPGTALVLLLVGPATNTSNILVLRQYIGTKGVLINLIAISLVALGFGYLTDGLYAHYHWPLSFNLHHVHEHLTIYHHMSGVVLTLLLLKGLYKDKIRPMMTKEGATCH